jgi:EAL domain-containing protein (putative c-di-GMP-specific phosphodiesterase class I)
MDEGQSSLYANGVVDASGGKPRVLIVDDEQAILRAYSRVLTGHGYAVTTASSGENGLELLAHDPIDVVISDLTMPGMTGIDFLREVRQKDPDLPVILMTACPSTETAARALEYGALRYLLKPVAKDAMERALKDGLHLRRMAMLKKQAAAIFGDYDKQLGERAGLTASLSRALTALFMVYQPIVRFSDRTILGYEALVRSAEPSLPHPGALFDAAERVGQVEALGRVIRQIAPVPMPKAPESALLFVNLHTRDLNDPSLFDPTTALAKIAGRVVLEITERASLHQVDDVHARVRDLRKMGYRIAIDDIGAGYAGLTSFAMLEPDVVKLDMALVRDIHKTPTKQKLVGSMVHLCRDLNIMLIAEGVETEAERDTLVGLGCDVFQGYFFGKPAAPFCDVSFGK